MFFYYRSYTMGSHGMGFRGVSQCLYQQRRWRLAFFDGFLKRSLAFEKFLNKKGESGSRKRARKKLDKRSPKTWSWMPKTYKNWVFIIISRRLRLKFRTIFYGTGGGGWKLFSPQRRRPKNLSKFSPIDSGDGGSAARLTPLDGMRSNFKSHGMEWDKLVSPMGRFFYPIQSHPFRSPVVNGSSHPLSEKCFL
jgi:hypothetical protein